MLRFSGSNSFIRSATKSCSRPWLVTPTKRRSCGCRKNRRIWAHGTTFMCDSARHCFKGCRFPAYAVPLPPARRRDRRRHTRQSNDRYWREHLVAVERRFDHGRGHKNSVSGRIDYRSGDWRLAQVRGRCCGERRERGGPRNRKGDSRSAVPERWYAGQDNEEKGRNGEGRRDYWPRRGGETKERGSERSAQGEK